MGRGTGRILVDERGDLAVAGRERLQNLVTRNDLVHGPVCRPPDVHVLDVSQLRAMLARKLEEIDELVVVESANHHRIDLQFAQPHRARARDSLGHRRKLGTAVERLETIWPSRVETHRNPTEARRLQRLHLASE